jgi:hypothetical protein
MVEPGRKIDQRASMVYQVRELLKNFAHTPGGFARFYSIT